MRKSITAVLVLTILVSGGYLLNEFYFKPNQAQKIDAQIQEMQTISCVETERGSVNFYDFSSLKSQNKDTIAVLDILGKKMPVVQTNELDSENKYLHTSFDGSYSSAGTLFMASDVIIGDSNVMTIYGHNMKNGTMFGELYKYRELSFLKENPVFSFANTTQGTMDTYKIVAVCSVSTNYKKNFYFPQTVYNTEEEFNKFKSKIKAHSFHVLDDFDYNDQIIILCTCAYGFEGERTLVVAKLDNNPIINTDNYKANSNRVLPNP